MIRQLEDWEARSITLPDGSVVSVAEQLEAAHRRYTSTRKTHHLRSILDGRKKPPLRPVPQYTFEDARFMATASLDEICAKYCCNTAMAERLKKYIPRLHDTSTS
jgi:hypothetical protein